jgi:regulator of replication initiation timing
MQLITIDNNTALLRKEVAEEIANFQRTIKHIQKREAELKQAILEEMEAKGIIKIESENLIITYIAPTDREKFDAKQFRADNPDEYDEYVSIVPVKASVRIKVKEK